MPDVNVALIACGAPLTERVPDLVAALIAQGWRPTVIGTSAAAGWLDGDAVAALTGEPARFDFRPPTQAKRGDPPDAVVVCPATFNTLNKAAAGAADTYALGVLCEALGTGTPTVVVPMVNDKLWGHPAWAPSLDVLRRAGVAILDIHTGAPEPKAVASGSGDKVVRDFDPAWLTDILHRVVDS